MNTIESTIRNKVEMWDSVAPRGVIDVILFAPQKQRRRFIKNMLTKQMAEF
jgi:hypothetical protein